MIGGNRLASYLLVATAIVVACTPLAGCTCEEGEAGDDDQGRMPALVLQTTPKLQPTVLLPQLQRLKRYLLKEEDIKRELEVLHPDIPRGKQSRYQIFVTPNAPAVKALAGQVEGAEEAYEAAIGWVWVADDVLNDVAEKWLLPREFLTSTPDYPGNPVPGRVASDCEEQANTLVSLLRAEGIRATDVRAVLGKVDVGDGQGGHVWVEIRRGGQWLPLEATSGPYWDDDAGELVSSGGVSFTYFARHDYPVVQVWAYYNDVFYLDPRSGSGNAPASWRG